MKTNHPMKAIGNTLHSVARSVQRKAQALHHALPERNLINEALQGITAQLRGHRPVETEGRMDPQMLDADPIFEDVKTALENALPEQHYNRDERGSLVRNGKVGGQLLKEAIEQRMESLRHAAGTFPVPGADAATEQDRRDARISLNAVKEQLQGLEDLMSLSGKGISASRKSGIRASITQMKNALDRAEQAFPRPRGSWSLSDASTTSEDASTSAST